MGYTTVSDRQKAVGGADIPVCQSPKANLSCVTWLLANGRQECLLHGLTALCLLAAFVFFTGCDQLSPQEAEQTSESEVFEKPNAQMPSIKHFIDRMRFPGGDNAEEVFEEQAFEMILIQGDPERGVKPFYLSKTEVRLEMFYPWAMGYGMDWPYDEVAMRLGFYPSEYWGFYSNHPWLFDEQYPALAMSRTVAEKYCETLSELTGRSYRLPTEKEWEHALSESGGVPKSRQSLLRIAHLDIEENWSEDFPFSPIPARVGTKSTDRLGLHDLLGNAAEWVTETGDERIARGGHYALPPEKLGPDWRAVEDIEVWNETYPNRPVSKSFFRDFPFTGIRLACDADQAPITPENPDPPAP